MSLQVRGQVIDTHAVDAWRSSVALYLRLRLLQVLTLDNRFHRRPNQGRPAFNIGSRRARFGLLGGGASGFTRRSGAQVQLDLIVLPHRRARSPFYWPLPAFGPSADRSAYYALC